MTVRARVTNWRSKGADRTGKARSAAAPRSARLTGGPPGLRAITRLLTRLSMSLAIQRACAAALAGRPPVVITMSPALTQRQGSGRSQACAQVTGREPPPAPAR